jgi:signal transduction histidine kinase
LLRNRTDVRAQTQALENKYESLQQAPDRQDKFISTLAHELRNQLAGMANSVSLLKISRDNVEDISLAAGTLEQELSLMRRLVDDLLDTTRIRTGKVRLDIHLMISEKLSNRR